SHHRLSNIVIEGFCSRSAHAEYRDRYKRKSNNRITSLLRRGEDLFTVFGHGTTTAFRGRPPRSHSFFRLRIRRLITRSTLPALLHNGEQIVRWCPMTAMPAMTIRPMIGHGYVPLHERL